MYPLGAFLFRRAAYVGGMTHPPATHPRTALITGGAQRVGRHMALALAADGYAVAVHCNTSTAAAEQLAAQIRAQGGRAEIVRADLSCRTDVAGLVAAARGAVGPLGVLINNASAFLSEPSGDTDALWDMHMAVNLHAAVRLSHDFAAQVGNDGRGAIVQMIDQKVWRLNPRDFSYTLSKSALWTATRTLAQALAPRVRVNAIAPGPLLPNDRMSAADFAHEARHTLLQHPARMDDVIAALRFFLMADSVTGQMLAVDSGQHLAWQTPDLQ